MILIDADILAYRIGFACKGESWATARSQLDNLLYDILVRAADESTEHQLYLTGKGNFRNDIATILPYKGTRTSEKPKHFHKLRAHMTKVWDAIVTEGIEADDAIAIRATELQDECVMVSVDKDFLQIRGHHYNFVKDVHVYIDDFTGMYNLYHQMLTGDRVDNIRGVVGIGQKKADKILADCKTEVDMYKAVLEAYKGNAEELLENARLLYLIRSEDDVWHPPEV